MDWSNKLFFRFTSYLWGIETLSHLMLLLSLALFTSYLWGIETAIMHGLLACSNRLYLTYEELKLPVSLFVVDNLFRFISYLWGIETKSVLIHHTIFFFVYILPMRNWNQGTEKQVAWANTVYILPMRNWNFVSRFANRRRH